MATTALQDVLPAPRLSEVDSVDLAVDPERAWQAVRHGDLGRSWLARAIFGVRALPVLLTGGRRADDPPVAPRVDDLVSSPERPGFQVLVDDPPHEFVVGAVGRVWRPRIDFVHVPSAEAYAAFDRPGYAKVAWAIRVTPLGQGATRVTFRLRVGTSDDESWERFERYWRLVGPGSKLVRRQVLSSLARQFGAPPSRGGRVPMPGDELLPDAQGEITHETVIRRPPEYVWPWLVQMGCRRAGWYRIDVVDNGGRRSARELHPELQDVEVGDVLPATVRGDDGFEVLRLRPNRSFVLAGLYDRMAERQLPFRAPRPSRYWHATWAFALDRVADDRTRLRVRARGAFDGGGRFHARWIRPVHRLMQSVQLRRLAARVEGRLPRDDWRDVAEGVSGGLVMAASFATPFLRSARSRWGVDAATARRRFPGDQLVPDPRWSWTHGIEIDAPPEAVWPWVAQVGADRAGFYSYQWLENLVGCGVRNAETVHGEWQVRVGDGLVLHPEMPPLEVVEVEPGRWFVTFGSPGTRTRDGSWVAATWLFLVEPVDETRTRFLSRYRISTSDDLATRMPYGPSLVEPVGFAMDRRMLLGVKRRAEQAHHRRPLRRMPLA
jgi:hypothetical protein